MEATLRAGCRAEDPGERCRNLDVATTWRDATCKSGLLPVWIAAYRYGEIGYRFCVNGATGRAAGTAPWSVAKISLAVLAALTALGFLLMRGCGRSRLPELGCRILRRPAAPPWHRLCSLSARVER